MGAPASAADVETMDKAIKAVRRQYDSAKQKMDAAADRFFATPEEVSMRGALAAVGAQLEKWATEKRAWAVRGQRDDGASYSVRSFLDFGQVTVADAVLSIAKENYDRSAFAALTYTVKETVKDVEVVVTSPALRWGLALAGVVVLVVVAAVVVRPRVAVG